jgi:DNA-binding Lrp family transcriptional regulator
MELNKKEKDVLTYLRNNSRYSYKYISTNLKISKDSVKNIHNKLIKNKIIKKHYVKEDTKYNYIIYISATNIITKNIDSKINNDYNSIFLYKQLLSTNELLIRIGCLENKEIRNFLAKIYKNLGHIIKDINILQITKEYFYNPFPKICNDIKISEYNKKDSSFEYFFKKARYDIKKEYKLSKNSKNILKYLNNNSREKIINISKKLNLSSDIIKTEIKKLILSKKILGFYTWIDFNEIGYKRIIYILNTIDTSSEKYNQFIKDIFNLDYTYRVYECIGKYNIYIEFIIKNYKNRDDIIEFLKQYSAIFLYVKEITTKS